MSNHVMPLMTNNINPFQAAQAHVEQVQKEKELAKIEEQVEKCATDCFDLLTSLQLDLSLVELECDLLEKGLQEDLQETVKQVERLRNNYLENLRWRQDHIRHCFSRIASEKDWHNSKNLSIPKEYKE
ncbi:MAG: hypothetical protein KGI80_04695 [Verrucomicrobiota bacterium]|nr:hypothetical protein [Verrucomicrobiota bacterium]